MRVGLARRRETLLVADRSGQAHALPAALVREQKRIDRVIEATGLDDVPGAEEDEVGHEDAILERGPERALGLGQRLLDLTAHARDGPQTRALSPSARTQQNVERTSNLATSSAEVNMSRRKAVFLKIL